MTKANYQCFINKMLESADEHVEVSQGNTMVRILRFNTSLGVCMAWIYKDSQSGTWYDYCEYRLRKRGAVVEPTMKIPSDPARFCEIFLKFPKAQYTVLACGRATRKPERLKGLHWFDSVAVDSGMRCQVFLSGLDLYVKCIYGRNWAIWIKISNCVPLIKYLSDMEFVAALRDMTGENDPMGFYFMEHVAAATRRYLEQLGEKSTII